MPCAFVRIRTSFSCTSICRKQGRLTGALFSVSVSVGSGFALSTRFQFGIPSLTGTGRWELSAEIQEIQRPSRFLIAVYAIGE
jgi:hypothetical protein